MIYDKCDFFDVKKEGMAINRQAHKLARRVGSGKNLKILVGKNITEEERSKLRYFCDIIQTAGINLDVEHI